MIAASSWALRAEQAHERAQARAGAPTPPPPGRECEFILGPSRKCRAFFHSGCSAAGQAPPSRLKCYKDVDCPTVRSQADGIVDGLSAALHDVTGRSAITEA